ncbi:DUF4303 domain-containing protein [Lysinibacillus sp. FSL K6-0057]|uniref:DUF4303 domain-containing protein n=1 Tax=unclassified Lysinibacillus TaxID=2636778 RepID=UPI00315933A8
MSEIDSMEQLADVIVCAARKTFLDLFKNGERYYYCTLCTTGEGHAPSVSAWSWEALERQAAKQTNSNISERASLIKWSYADSPYYCYGEENFSNVRQCFNKRPYIYTLEGEAWQQELALRLAAMELAMKKLDEEGLFALNQTRDSVCILVEVMPPEEINTEIALRLNHQSSTALQQWLLEAAE